MKINAAIIGILFLSLFAQTSLAQVLQVDTLEYKGPAEKFINIVVLGDGYTVAQQDVFVTDAADLSDYLLSQAPWSNYRSYFNVFAIHVISNESGTKHPNNASDCNSANVPVSNPDTYLQCSFDRFGIHRLVSPTNTGNLVNVLSSNFPLYDQVLIIANSPYYGGSGGAFATSTLDGASAEVMAHEVGHSFAGLADEYYAGDQYAAEKPNMTQHTDPSQVRWKNWMNTPGIGIYQHCCGGNSSVWYRPHNNCKMRVLGPAYCAVCAETIIERIHNLINPVIAYTPANLTVSSPDPLLPFELSQLAIPSPNTLKIVWTLDGQFFESGSTAVAVNQAGLSAGIHLLTVTVEDTTGLVRKDNHNSIHVSAVSWTINKTSSGTAISASDNRFSISLWPNPVTTTIHLLLESENKAPLSVAVYDLNGKEMKRLSKLRFDNGRFEKTIVVSDIATGTYTLVIEAGTARYSRIFVKL